MILQWLLAEIEYKIDPLQFSFRRGHSTEHYLVRLLHDLLEHRENPDALAEITISDSVKPFDLLDYETNQRSPSPASSLSGRQKCVQLENVETTNSQDIMSGVAKGSKLGPILFVIVIQHKQRYKFADDLSPSLLHFLSQTPSQLIPLVAELQHQADEVKL